MRCVPRARGAVAEFDLDRGPEAFTSDPDRLADREMAFKELEVEDEHIKGICSLMEEIRDR